MIARGLLPLKSVLSEHPLGRYAYGANSSPVGGGTNPGKLDFLGRVPVGGGNGVWGQGGLSRPCPPSFSDENPTLPMSSGQDGDDIPPAESRAGGSEGGGGGVAVVEGSYRRSGARGAPQLFAHKLYKLVDEEDPEIVDWMPDGQGFQVKDMDRFCAEIISKYFNHCKFTSFQRQLNLYGFKKRRGDKAGAFYHPHFRRGQQHLLRRVRRQRVNRDLLAAAQRAAAANRRNAAMSGSLVGQEQFGRESAMHAGSDMARRRSTGSDGMDHLDTMARRDGFGSEVAMADGRWSDVGSSNVRPGTDRQGEHMGWDWGGMNSGAKSHSNTSPRPYQAPVSHLPARPSAPIHHSEQNNPFRLPVSYVHRSQNPALHMPFQTLPLPGIPHSAPPHLLHHQQSSTVTSQGPLPGVNGPSGPIAAAVAAVRAAATGSNRDVPPPSRLGDVAPNVQQAPWQMIRSPSMQHPSTTHFHEQGMAAPSAQIPGERVVSAAGGAPGDDLEFIGLFDQSWDGGDVSHYGQGQGHSRAQLPGLAGAGGATGGQGRRVGSGQRLPSTLGPGSYR